jgi:hypothetical protein
MATVLGCRTARQPPPEPELIAVVEGDDHLEVLRGRDSDWKVVTTIPRTARSLRFAPGSTALAWIEDETTSNAPKMLGWLSAPLGAPARSLGPLGLRRAEAAGLELSPQGDAIFLTEQGLLQSTSRSAPQRGTHPLWTDAGLVYVKPDNCLANVAPPVCGNALRPLEGRDEVLLSRTNTGLTWSDAHGARSFALRDVIDARRQPSSSAVAVIHRVDDDGRTREALSLWTGGDTLTELLRADVIISAEWDGATLLVVREEHVAIIYDVLLAHAPEEFGGEAMSGEALRVDPRTQTTTRLPWFEGKRVRRLIRADN